MSGSPIRQDTYSKIVDIGAVEKCGILHKCAVCEVSHGTRGSSCSALIYGHIAQLAEQRTLNPKVAGSTPVMSTHGKTPYP